MATTPSNYQLGDVYDGLLASGNYPVSLRGDGSDDAAKVTFLDRDIAAFTYLIHKNAPFTERIKVNDRMYKTREFQELERFYTVALGSNTSGSYIADTYDRIIALPNSEAAEIQVNNVFFVMGLYALVTGAGMVAGQVYAGNSNSGTPASGTYNAGPDLGWDVGMNPTGVRFSRTRGKNADGYYYGDYEQVKVVGKGAPDSAGTGFTTITLERCYFGPSEIDAGGRRVPPSIVYSTSGITNTTAGGTGHTGFEHARIIAGDRLLRAMPVAMEGTNAPDGVHKLPETDVNFTQEFKYAVSWTKESEIVTKKVKSRTGFDPIQAQRWMVKRQGNRDREYSNLMGRKSNYSIMGKEEYIQGGVRPWVAKDDTHIIVYPGPQITWPGLLDMGKAIFRLGGSMERVCFTGITMDAELRKSFWNEHLFYNKEASKEFNMEVNTLFVSGGKLHLIISQVMEENGLGNEMLCLELSKSDAFEPVTHEGWDYRIEKDIQEPGAMIYKEQIIGMFGLRRRYRDYHCIIDFSNCVTL